MFIYFLLLLLLCVFMFLNIPIFVVRHQNNHFIKSINWLFVLFVFFSLFLLAYGRDIRVGTDYYLYQSFYVSRLYKEFDPFIVMIYDIAHYFDQFRIVTALSSIIFLTSFFYLQKKYAYSIVNFTFFFVTSFLYFFFLNGLRQALAMAVLWIGLMLLDKSRKKSLFYYFIIVLIAGQFHVSAYFTFVFIIVLYFKVTRRIILIGFLIMAIGFFTGIIKESVSGLLMQVGIYTEKYSQNLDFFFIQNKEKSIVQFLPVAAQFAFFFIWVHWRKINKVATNLSIENLYFLFLMLYTAAGIEAVDRFQVYLSPSVLFFYDMVLFKLMVQSHTKTERIFGYLFAFVIIFFWILYYSLRVIQNTNGILPYLFW
jgi:hypothetical protein